MLACVPAKVFKTNLMTYVHIRHIHDTIFSYFVSNNKGRLVNMGLQKNWIQNILEVLHQGPLVCLLYAATALIQLCALWAAPVAEWVRSLNFSALNQSIT